LLREKTVRTWGGGRGAERRKKTKKCQKNVLYINGESLYAGKLSIDFKRKGADDRSRSGLESEKAMSVKKEI